MVDLVEQPAQDCPDCKSMAPPWMATFADMATLLMAFFVLILSFAELNVPKYKAVSGSLRTAFGMQREIQASEAPRADNVIARNFQTMKTDPTTANVVQEQTTKDEQPEDPILKITSRVSRAETNADVEILAEAFAVELAEGKVQIDADDDRIKVTIVEQDNAYTDSERTPGKKGARINQDTIEIYAKLAEARSLLVSELIVAKQVSEDAAERLRRRAADAAQKQSDIDAQFQQLQLVLSQQIESGAANIVKSDERFIITLEDKGLFLSGTADLDPSILSTINQIADTIAQADSLVRIQGHSDNRPVGFSEQFASNWDLSSARAASVANHMINNRGLNEQRFSVTGFADTEPVASNASEAGRQRNRRVEIIIDN
jgi:chemotaxis protein MotB